MSDDVPDPLWLRNLRAQASGSEPVHEESVRAGAAYAVAEIDRLRSLLPPAGLPATIASVDDVETVVRAAGLHQFVVFGHRCWTGAVELRAVQEHGWSTSTPFGMETSWGAPSAVLWHAIQAARSAS